MSYNLHNGGIHCDVCGSEWMDRRYQAYGRRGNGKVKHVCLPCLGRGAYWCSACQDVHASQNECPQSPLLDLV